MSSMIRAAARAGSSLFMIERPTTRILDDAGFLYTVDADLPKLWALAAKQLDLPQTGTRYGYSRRFSEVCQAVMNQFGAIRSRVGDAHLSRDGSFGSF
jgi:hypothetical protein